jgi:hypothetical protein
VAVKWAQHGGALLGEQVRPHGLMTQSKLLRSFGGAEVEPS